MFFIMLAAGTSSRYEGANKLLLPYKGTTLVSHCVAQALKASKIIGNSEVIVVTGFEADKVKEELNSRFGSEIIVLENKNYLNGQFSSTKVGVDFIKDKDAPFFICPCDLPLVSEIDYILLTNFYNTKRNAIRPYVKNTPAHPVLINPKLIDKILNTDDSKSMKDILSTGLFPIYIEDKAGIKDIDTVENYNKLKQ